MSPVSRHITSPQPQVMWNPKSSATSTIEARLCEAYGFARQSELCTIDTVHHTGIRIATPCATVCLQQYILRFNVKPLKVSITFKLKVRCKTKKKNFSETFGLRIHDMHRDLRCQATVTASLVHCTKPPGRTLA